MSSAPPVAAVGVLTAHRSDLLHACLASIARAACVIDNVPVFVFINGTASAGCSEQLCKQFGVSVWTSPASVSLAAAWNRLAQSAASAGAKYVALLNDDVEVTDWWIDALVAYMTEVGADCGTVGLPQHAGPAPIDPPPAAASVEVRAYNARILSSCGYCFAFPIAAWAQVGGFDAGYWRFYEEVDFGLALVRAGMRNYMLCAPAVYHRIGATMATFGGGVNDLNLRMSRERFVRKWSARLGIALSPDADAAALLAAEGEITRTALAAVSTDDRPVCARLDIDNLPPIAEHPCVAVGARPAAC